VGVVDKTEEQPRALWRATHAPGRKALAPLARGAAGVDGRRAQTPGEIRGNARFWGTALRWIRSSPPGRTTTNQRRS